MWTLTKRGVESGYKKSFRLSVICYQCSFFCKMNNVEGFLVVYKEKIWEEMKNLIEMYTKTAWDLR